MSYRPNAPHGVAESAVPSRRSDRTVKPTGLAVTRPLFQNGMEKLHLINEVMARARMRDLWRSQHQHRHPRSSSQILRDVKRNRARYLCQAVALK